MWCNSKIYNGESTKVLLTPKLKWKWKINPICDLYINSKPHRSVCLWYATGPQCDTRWPVISVDKERETSLEVSIGGGQIWRRSGLISGLSIGRQVLDETRLERHKLANGCPDVVWGRYVCGGYLE